ncbi:uncharacterized protein F5891DRAFT_1207971 [Suillus fuscotomentosus]|uniref:Uncharacterized protein n=1 Tax=Suillus fuscotomentosus TaxID=1912939 RepID=A0AAD4HF43_9AGAM|nr:uncharacterized protein F5891DRAFT_1207971 [Suillus fuscotomentosus]KAG1893174.1 hypothetical protein F5891DRAFT_1207971 [Suillus fuscotomentosus]
MSQADGSTLHDRTPPVEDREDDDGLPSQQGPESLQTSPQSMFLQARQRRKIAELEGKIEVVESGRAVKERHAHHFVRRGLKRVVVLFDTVEDLVAENDRRYEDNDEDATLDQDRLESGYSILMRTLPWFLKKTSDMEHDDYMRMLKLLRQGADGARGDDTSKLKALVSDWVNREFRPNPPIDINDKHSHGFTSDACGKLLCPAELDWNDPVAGIRDCSDGHIVTDFSFPVFLYDKYVADPENLEEGLFKGKILLQGYKAVFTSPSSAKDVEGDGDGADVIQNNRRANKAVLAGIKVKKHVAQIIKMEKVTPRSIAYIACQFWQTIVDFFERPPGREAQHRVDKLLEWWTRKVFGRSCREDLTNVVKARMSVNALARQRAQIDDATFDSN